MKEKLLFVYPHTSSFIDLDIKILSENFEVIKSKYNWKNKIKTPLYLFQQFFYLLFNTYKFQFIIISFGGYWSFLPSLFGKIFNVKTFIILHGTDCTAFDEINYGSLRKFPLRQFCKWSYSLAYQLLPVSTSLVYTENTYYKEGKVIRQGYKYFFPQLKTNFKAIPNGFELDKWISPNENHIQRKPNSFISVASGSSIYLKGIDLILEISKTFKDAEFYIVGYSDQAGKYKAYKNVFFMGRLTHNELYELYKSSKYYLQLSITEGFGCALCEAMLSGCIPIGSNVNEIPTIIGNCGYILKYRDSNLLIELIKKVLAEERNELGIDARNRIINHYPLKRRAKELMDELKK